MMASNFTSLADLAQQLARERHADTASVIKELLHYEILQALVESGSSSHLVFQGGTALRLCYGGIRYSEDLDFAGGTDFDASSMQPFIEHITQSVGNRYGLFIEVAEHHRQAILDPRLKSSACGSISVIRWKAKVRIPQLDRSAKQAYLIQVVVAKIPAYSCELLRLRTMSESVPYAYRAICLNSESAEEILADKIIALGARPYIKQRDLWDIHMLAQDLVPLNVKMVWNKINDYHLDNAAFCQNLHNRIVQLDDANEVSAFREEMLRFLEGQHQRIIQDVSTVREILAMVAKVVRILLDQLTIEE